MNQITVDEYTRFYCINIKIEKDRPVTELEAIEAAKRELDREVIRRQASYNKRLFGGAS